MLQAGFRKEAFPAPLQRSSAQRLLCQISSGAEHSSPRRFPSSNSARQGSPAEPPAPAGRDPGLSQLRGCGTAGDGHRVTAADYSTQQAPPAGLALTAGADAEPPEPIHGTRRKCQQTRRPAGRVIPATGQDTADKPRQGRPGAVTQRSPTLDRSPSSISTAWTTAPHPPAPPFHPAVIF